MTVEKDLLVIKTEIDNLKQTKAQAEGRLEEQMAQLERDHGCKTVAQAEKNMAKLDEQIKEADKELETGVATLKEKLGMD